MNRAFNRPAGRTIHHLAFGAAIIGAAIAAAAPATTASALPAAGVTQATAPAGTQIVGGQLIQTAPKIIRIKRARRINASEGVGGASCWVTYEKWGTVFYGTCPY